MPTMSKLFAAILIAALGYFAADRVAVNLPEEIPPGVMRPVMAFFGIFVGWRLLGPRTGGGMRASMGLGLSSAALLTIIGVFWFAGYEMLRRALRKAYGGNPFEALQDMFQIAVDRLEHLAHADVVAVLVIGGLLAGAICEFVGRRWS